MYCKLYYKVTLSTCCILSEFYLVTLFTCMLCNASMLLFFCNTVQHCSSAKLFMATVNVFYDILIGFSFLVLYIVCYCYYRHSRIAIAETMCSFCSGVLLLLAKDVAYSLLILIIFKLLFLKSIFHTSLRIKLVQNLNLLYLYYID